MQKLRFSHHALQRAKERYISERQMREAIAYPDKVEASKRNAKRVLIKTIYHNSFLNKDHLLLIVCERTTSEITVVTIIDTSKISKYY